MDNPGPADTARIRTLGVAGNLQDLAGKPDFKQGFNDGRAQRPLASYGTVYLVGYTQGDLRKPR